MQKKLLAVALAGAFGAPAVALAQSSTVQVFGTMYVEYTVHAHQGSGLSSTDFIQTPGSEIGFKGEEKLGGGLSAWFQCASTADPRGESQNGWCSRNSALGLKGGFGNVFIGNWDTPFKRTISPTAVGSNDTGIWGSAFLLTGNSTTTGVQVASPSRGVFKRRQNNLISYDSPTFAGFQVMAAFTSSQASTATLSAAENNKPRVLSIGGQYSAGPLYVSAAYELHKNFNTIAIGARQGDDHAWQIGAAYTWGPVRFGGQYTRQEFESGTIAAPLDNHVSAWTAGVDWNIVGPHGLRAAYVQAGDMKGSVGGGGFSGRPVATAAGNTGAKMYQIRYVYTFSKRTEFNFGYVKLNNESGAGYLLGGLSTPVAGGTDQSAWAFAVRHTF